MLDSRFFVLSVILVLSCVRTCAGSGVLYDPPSRGVMWKYGFSTEKDYDYMQSNCGGGKGLKKCGFCGDPAPGPRLHEAGGRFGSNIITRHYPEGTKEISVRVELLSGEKGHFEFRVCPVNNGSVNQTCLDRYKLPIKEGYMKRTPMKFYPSKQGDHHLTLALPPGLKCERCVLQWRYHTGNSWGRDEKTGKEGMGHGLQDEFLNCADIRIGGSIPESVFTNPTMLGADSPRGLVRPSLKKLRKGGPRVGVAPGLVNKALPSTAHTETADSGVVIQHFSEWTKPKVSQEDLTEGISGRHVIKTSNDKSLKHILAGQAKSSGSDAMPKAVVSGKTTAFTSKTLGQLEKGVHSSTVRTQKMDRIAMTMGETGTQSSQTVLETGTDFTAMALPSTAHTKTADSGVVIQHFSEWTKPKVSQEDLTKGISGRHVIKTSNDKSPKPILAGQAKSSGSESKAVVSGKTTAFTSKTLGQLEKGVHSSTVHTQKMDKVVMTMGETGTQSSQTVFETGTDLTAMGETATQAKETSKKDSSFVNKLSGIDIAKLREKYPSLPTFNQLMEFKKSGSITGATGAVGSHGTVEGGAVSMETVGMEFGTVVTGSEMATHGRETGGSINMGGTSIDQAVHGTMATMHSTSTAQESGSVSLDGALVDTYPDSSLIGGADSVGLNSGTAMTDLTSAQSVTKLITSGSDIHGLDIHAVGQQIHSLPSVDAALHAPSNKHPMGAASAVGSVSMGMGATETIGSSNIKSGAAGTQDAIVSASGGTVVDTRSTLSVPVDTISNTFALPTGALTSALVSQFGLTDGNISDIDIQRLREMYPGLAGFNTNILRTVILRLQKQRAGGAVSGSVTMGTGLQDAIVHTATVDIGQHIQGAKANTGSNVATQQVENVRMSDGTINMGGSVAGQGGMATMHDNSIAQEPGTIPLDGGLIDTYPDPSLSAIDAFINLPSNEHAMGAAGASGSVTMGSSAVGPLNLLMSASGGTVVDTSSKLSVSVDKISNTVAFPTGGITSAVVSQLGLTDGNVSDMDIQRLREMYPVLAGFNTNILRTVIIRLQKQKAGGAASGSVTMGTGLQDAIVDTATDNIGHQVKSIQGGTTTTGNNVVSQQVGNIRMAGGTINMGGTVTGEGVDGAMVTMHDNSIAQRSGTVPLDGGLVDTYPDPSLSAIDTAMNLPINEQAMGAATATGSVAMESGAVGTQDALMFASGGTVVDTSSILSLPVDTISNTVALPAGEMTSAFVSQLGLIDGNISDLDIQRLRERYPFLARFNTNILRTVVRRLQQQLPSDAVSSAVAGAQSRNAASGLAMDAMTHGHNVAPVSTSNFDTGSQIASTSTETINSFGNNMQSGMFAVHENSGFHVDPVVVDATAGAQQATGFLSRSARIQDMSLSAGPVIEAGAHFVEGGHFIDGTSVDGTTSSSTGSSGHVDSTSSIGQMSANNVNVDATSVQSSRPTVETIYASHTDGSGSMGHQNAFDTSLVSDLVGTESNILMLHSAGSGNVVRGSGTHLSEGMATKTVVARTTPDNQGNGVVNSGNAVLTSVDTTSGQGSKVSVETHIDVNTIKEPHSGVLSPIVNSVVKSNLFGSDGPLVGVPLGGVAKQHAEVVIQNMLDHLPTSSSIVKTESASRTSQSQSNMIANQPNNALAPMGRMSNTHPPIQGPAVPEMSSNAAGTATSVNIPGSANSVGTLTQQVNTLIRQQQTRAHDKAIIARELASFDIGRTGGSQRSVVMSRGHDNSVLLDFSNMDSSLAGSGMEGTLMGGAGGGLRRQRGGVFMPNMNGRVTNSFVGGAMRGAGFTSIDGRSDSRVLGVDSRMFPTGMTGGLLTGPPAVRSPSVRTIEASRNTERGGAGGIGGGFQPERRFNSGFVDLSRSNGGMTGDGRVTSHGHQDGSRGSSMFSQSSVGSRSGATGRVTGTRGMNSDVRVFSVNGMTRGSATGMGGTNGRMGVTMPGMGGPSGRMGMSTTGMGGFMGRTGASMTGMGGPSGRMGVSMTGMGRGGMPPGFGPMGGFRRPPIGRFGPVGRMSMATGPYPGVSGYPFPGAGMPFRRGPPFGSFGF